MSGETRRHREPVHFITELEQIECLVSPVRGLLLSTLCGAGPCSVGELARLVGRKPRALYYHLDALVDSGLVVEVGTRPTRRRQETLYDSIADTVMLDERTQRDPAWQDAHRRAVAATLRQTMRGYDMAIEHAAALEPDHAPEMRMQSMQAQLDEEGLKTVLARLEELLSEMRREREKRNGPFYTLTVTLGPVVDAVHPGDQDDAS